MNTSVSKPTSTTLDLTKSIRHYTADALAAGARKMWDYGIHAQRAEATVESMADLLQRGQTVAALRIGQQFLSTDAVYDVIRSMLSVMPENANPMEDLRQSAQALS